jgi:ABC-type glycerol-3-phosphate transport system permease component
MSLRTGALAQTRTGARRRARSPLRRLAPLLWHLPMIAGTVVLSVPLAWLLSTSLKLEGREFVVPPEWIPNPIVWENYPRAMTTLPFYLYFWNTLIVTLGSLSGTLLTASMAAFAFARLRFPGRGFLFVLLLSTLMLPQAVTLIPKFITFRYLGWINTLNPLWVPWWFGGGAFNVFLLRQFLMTLPHELDEAARIDGASNWRIYWSVLMPLCRPALITVAIFSFIHSWNDFLEPLIYLHDAKLRTLALGLRGFQDLYATQWTLMMAASAVIIAPVLLLFFVCQRYFIRGIHLTGLAGR